MSKVCVLGSCLSVNISPSRSFFFSEFGRKGCRTATELGQNLGHAANFFQIAMEKTFGRLQWWSAAHPDNVSLKPTLMELALPAARPATPPPHPPTGLGFPCSAHNAVHSHTATSVCVRDRQRCGLCVSLCTRSHILGTERSLSVNETRRGGVKRLCSDLLYRTGIPSTVTSFSATFVLSKWPTSNLDIGQEA